MSGGGRKTLKTLIGTYPHTALLKSGALRSDRLDFEFTEIVPVWDGFKGMIRDDKYDVSEMAVVTYLLAKAHGKPLALLPAAMIGRFQHPYAIYNATKGPMTPADLKGKRVGIRSFTTTTGAWIDPRYPGQRLRCRPRQHRMDNLRGAARRGVQGHHATRAGGKKDRADAARRRARRGARRVVR
jgi:hypothetical protein